MLVSYLVVLFVVLGALWHLRSAGPAAAPPQRINVTLESPESADQEAPEVALPVQQQAGGDPGEAENHE